MKFGFELFAGNKSYIMLSNKKNVTEAIARKLTVKLFSDYGNISKWNEATDEERAATVKAMKYRVTPVAIEYSYISTGRRFLEIRSLNHAQDADSYYGMSSIPESYFDQYIIFDEV